MNEIPATNHIFAGMLKRRLSSLIQRIMAGESFIIMDDSTGEPIADLVPVADEDKVSNTHEDEI